MFALEQGKWDATVKVVAGGRRGIGLMGSVRRRDGAELEKATHLPELFGEKHSQVLVGTVYGETGGGGGGGEGWNRHGDGWIIARSMSKLYSSISDPSRSIFTCHVTPSVPRTRPKKEGPPAHILPRGCILCSLFSCCSPQIHQFHRIFTQSIPPTIPEPLRSLTKPSLPIGHSSKPRSRIPTAFPDWKNLTTPLHTPSLHTPFRLRLRIILLSRPHPTFPQGQYLQN